MDFLTSLPADLVALADPSVRGAAPLLRPPDSAGEAQSPTTPFALCLALLTEPLSSGEAWPATGKELPVVLLEPAVEPVASATDALFGLAPTALTTAARQAGLLPVDAALAEAAEAAPGVALLGRATTPAALALPPLVGSAPTVDPLAAAAPTDLDPLAALAGLAAEAEPAPLETAAQPAAGTSAKPAAAPSWLEAFAEQRLQRPAALPPSELRAPTPISPGSAGAAGFAQSQLDAVAAAPAAELPIAVRRLDLPKLATSAIMAGDTASVGQADWWAPAAGTTTTAAALPAPASPGAPVDLRSPNWQEAFANRVQWLVDTQVGEARIKLNPPELGAVDVTISLVDDKTYVQLTTATAAARDELSQSLPRLRELFTGSGLELGGASVHNGRDGHASGDGRGTGAAEPRWFAGFAEPGDELAAGPLRRSLGRIDVFA